MKNSGASLLKFEVTDKSEGIRGGKSTDADADADAARANSLGFEVEKQLGEPESMGVNSSVHDSGEKVNENVKNVVVPEEGEMGGPNKEILDSIVSQDMEDSRADCKDDVNLGFVGDNLVINLKEEEEKEEVKFVEDIEVISVEEDQEKGEVEFGGDTEVVSVEEEQEKKEEVEFGGDTEVVTVEEEQEKKEEEEKEDEISRKRKRELPRSMFGLTWDVGGRECPKGDGLKAANVEGNNDCKSKNVEQESIKCILEGLRMIANFKVSNGDDNRKVDILETAKRRGMVFPRSRFLPKIEEDEKED